MAIQYQIDKEANLLFCKLDAPVTLDELKSTFHSLEQDPDFRPGFRILVDRTGVSEMSSTVHVNDAMDLVRKQMEKLGECRCAIVVSGLGNFGMARMASTLAEGSNIEMRPFMDMESARTWLGVE
jgi:hypothetical protein